jgi:hypothetical protein
VDRSLEIKVAVLEERIDSHERLGLIPLTARQEQHAERIGKLEEFRGKVYGAVAVSGLLGGTVGTILQWVLAKV